MPTKMRCRKCGGTMLASEDVYSAYFACLQCGATHEPAKLGSLDEELAAALAPHRERLGLTVARR
jgi:DNA-directed RNA polymerase subunit M/transcription elongation factor TFIIS